MKITTYASATAIALALSIGAAAADDQFSVMKNVSSATPMTSAQLDETVGTGLQTAVKVALNRINAFINSGGNSKSLQDNSNGNGNGALGAIFVILNNPSP